jgi:hypothetical protein
LRFVILFVFDQMSQNSTQVKLNLYYPLPPVVQKEVACIKKRGTMLTITPCRGCQKPLKSKQAVYQHEDTCMIVNGIFGTERTVESSETSKKQAKDYLNKLENRILDLEKTIKEIKRYGCGCNSVVGVKRGRSNQKTDAELLNSNASARPKLTLSELINAATTRVSTMGSGEARPSPTMNKYLKVVVDMSLGNGIVALLRDTYATISVDGSVDAGDLWFPILHKFKKRSYLVYDKSPDTNTELRSMDEWKKGTESGLQALIDQIHACLRNAYFCWREANKDLLDVVPSIGKEDFILSLKIVKYGMQQSDIKSVANEVRDWITQRTDKCIELMN